MGVPKFYRWISQRYPCINQILRENEVVPIDHLYLDMNGIIHTSSHSENMAFSTYNEEHVFQLIADYVNHLTCMIKPRRTLFIAVDGVAPRAKMTQQRARRFQGPKETAAEIKRRKNKGMEIDEKALFDPNVISPGTEFMVRLHDFLKKFIASQITSDPVWRRIDIIFSGHDAPGEGEQKIREYMSYRRSLPDYKPTERHCLYGMDADLIFLGLATHEPNLCILRENVYTVKSPRPQDIPFCLIHLSVLREYIELEFKCLESQLSFPYNLERIIDDWIFLGYLLGNDFIPHLPNMHIHAESLTTLWDAYQVVLPQLDGYLHDFGQLNLERFHVLISELAKFDLNWFEDRAADQRWMQGKHGARMARELEQLGKGSAKSKTPPLAAAEAIAPFFGACDDAVPQDCALGDSTKSPLPTGSKDNVDTELAEFFGELTAEGSVNKEESHEAVEASVLSDGEGDDSEDSEEDSQEDEEEEEEEGDGDLENLGEIWHDKNGDSVNAFSADEDFDEDAVAYRMHRQYYYAEKLKIDIRGESKAVSKDFVEAALLPICREYVKTLQWVLDYYFTTVVDWKYFYPYHYSPFASDLVIFTKRFIKGGVDYDNRENWAGFTPNTKPLLPFEQQMFIMPPSSASILPPPYRWLLATSGTPVSEFFPEDFETDINGKLAEWEAVVLIPFIDEAKMLAAMAPCTQHLSPVDAKRNVHRGHLLLLAKDRPRCLSPGLAFESLLSEEVDGEFFRAHVLRDSKRCNEVYCSLPRRIDPSYPSLSRIPFTFEVKRVGVHTFSFPSKSESLLLTVDHPAGRTALEPDSLKVLARRYLGRAVATGWPYSRFVTPIIIMDEEEIWEVSTQESRTSSSRIVNRSALRRLDESDPELPFWASVRWLRSQAGWTVNRLKDRCAITFAASQPRAALICVPTSASMFTLVVPDKHNGVQPSHFRLRPLCTRLPTITKQTTFEPAGCRRGGTRPANKQCLTADANQSLRLGPKLSLEILDLTVDAESSSLERSFEELFPSASNVVIFGVKRKRFGLLGEIAGIAKNGKLSVQLYPDPPLAKDPQTVSLTALEADELSYLTLSEMSRELCLTVHIIRRLVDDFMVLVPSPTPDGGKKAKERPNRANIGLGLQMHRNFAAVVGWSRFSQLKKTWVYSRRVVDAIAKYYELFPEVVDFIGQWDPMSAIPEISAVFPTDTFHRFTQLRTFLRVEVKKNRTVTNADAPLLDKAGLVVVENSLLPGTTPPASTDRIVVEVAPCDLFTVLPEGGRLVPRFYIDWLKTWEKEIDRFSLLDRVIYVGPQHTMFGLGGFIIGVYPILGQETIEVMFDREIENGISIRGSSNRCAVVDPVHLLHYPRFAQPDASSVTIEGKVGDAAKQPPPRPAAVKGHAATPRASRRKHPPSARDVMVGLLPQEWLDSPPIDFASCSQPKEPKNRKKASPKKEFGSERKSPPKSPPSSLSSQTNKASPAAAATQAVPPRFLKQQLQMQQAKPLRQRHRQPPNLMQMPVEQPPEASCQPQFQSPPIHCVGGYEAQPPSFLPPTTWQATLSVCEPNVDSAPLITDGGMMEYCLPQSPPSQAAAPAPTFPSHPALGSRFVPLEDAVGGTCFVDLSTGLKLTLADLQPLLLASQQQPMAQPQDYFTPPQEHLMMMMPTPQPSLSQYAVDACPPAQFKTEFVPNQARLASMKPKRQ
uniref:5'-3' exoribonuclease 1 n=2 Tax=Mesocestoides corti TaxID=53468 RepID=A0A5K3F884_MESCO